MRCFRVTLLALLLAAIPALGFGQNAPVTPRIFGMDEEAVRSTWGRPSVLKMDWNETIGAYDALRYDRLPSPPLDPPGGRSLTVVLQDDRVVGAIEVTPFEEEARSRKRLRNRVLRVEQVWGPTEHRHKSWAYWLRDDKAYHIILFTEAANKKMPRGDATVIAVLGAEKVFGMLEKRVPYGNRR